MKETGETSSEKGDAFSQDMKSNASARALAPEHQISRSCQEALKAVFKGPCRAEAREMATMCKLAEHHLKNMISKADRSNWHTVAIGNFNSSSIPTADSREPTEYKLNM